MKIGLVILLTLVGKFLAFFRDIAIATAFGANGETDAYFIAVNVPGMVWVAIFTTISSVFLPQYIAEKHKSRSLAELYASESIRVYLFLALVVASATAIFARLIVALSAPQASEATIALATEFTRIIAFGYVFTAYVGVQNALQQANGRFVAPVSVPVVNHAITITFIVLGMYFGDLQLAVIGGVVGWIVQAPIQRSQTRTIYRSRLALNVRPETWRRLLLLSTPMILAVILDQLNIFIGTAIASDFGAGAISHLNYASRLTLFISGVFSWLVSYLFFPELASKAAQGDDRGNADVLTRALGLVLVSTAPAVAGALALRTDIIALIYQRGAFRAEDVQTTATLFGILGLGVMFVATRELLNRVFFSYQKTMAPLLIGIVSAAVNIVSSLVLSRSFGIAGIAAGASISALTFCIGQFSVLSVWKRELLTRRLAKYFLSSILAGSAAFAAVDSLHSVLSNWPLLVRFLFAGPIVLAVYTPFLLGFLCLWGIKPSVFHAELRGLPNGDPRPAL